ncbi:hypothetical protein CYY_008165 [Polysphondylium violaceum]|uniref:Zinc finger CCCH domain-containing protein 14 n=1 Tax=Polysphondylium violaceum TaxID=133409 RepID=A0A8J4V1J8_9MYCE|nr:hypothetical protein CYY_008165 [Polysphondylium violaceum]
METLGNYSYTGEHVTFIQNQVKQYLDCDDILTEYISVMVRNNKTKSEIINDLSDFIGSEKATSFVGWLWNFIPSYFASATSNSNNTTTTSKPVSPTNESQESKKPTSRLILNAVKEASEDTKNIKLQSESTEMEQEEDTEQEHTNGNSGSVFKKKFNRDNNNNNNNNNRDNHRDNNNRDKRNRNNNNNNNNGRDPTFTITFNSDSYSKKRKNNSRDDDPLEHSLDEEIELMNGNNNNNNGTPSKKSKKERCQFWPLCKNGDACPYHHPTTQCMLFPNCQFGNKCLYIHPSIPCKFGVNCTNENCVYNHPQRSMMPAAEANCRYGFSCPNKKTGCSFYHPPLACKFGEKCTNGRSCPYGHGKPCLFGASCVTPGCYFAHHLTESAFPECKFGKECTNPKCKFTHSDRENTEDLSNTLPATPTSMETRDDLTVSMEAIDNIPQDSTSEAVTTEI